MAKKAWPWSKDKPLRSFPTDAADLYRDHISPHDMTGPATLIEKTLGEKAANDLNPLSYVEGLYEGAIGKPVAAIKQLHSGISPESDTVESLENSNQSLAKAAGVMTGQIIDLSILALVSRAALKPILGAAIDSTIGNTTKMFLAGSLNGGLLTPDDKLEAGQSLIKGRITSALVSGSTFAVMGGADRAMEGLSVFKSKTIGLSALRSAIAGGAGGTTEAYANAYLHEGRLASGTEVVKASAQYAAFSLGMTGLHMGALKVAGLDPVQSAYYRTKWDMDKGLVEGKRLGYAKLNDLNMRHPLQRIGDLVLGTDNSPVGKRAPLTTENNPVRAFDQHYAQFIKDIQDNEAHDHADNYEERRAAFLRTNAIKTNFAEQLLTVWHGTAEKPGIAQYTDAELAGDGSSTVDYVAQVRKALTEPLKRPDYGSQPSPFEEAMAKLAPVDLEGAYEPYEILNNLGAAKERFFQYDERQMSKQMSLPAEHHYVTRAYGTPLSWMPFEPTEKLANLFHCSISKALDSTLVERALLPASELRLRGIGQVAGESADQEFPKRHISMSRNFSEAFCYHRHSPAYLTDYPIVFGIARDVVSKSWLAGISEPGEILTDKLKVGSSLMQKLGLRKPEITHIYVPDTRLDEVNQMLNNRRVSGVRVVGFNNMQTPQWTTVTPEQLDIF